MEDLENKILSNSTLQEKTKEYLKKFERFVNNKKLNWQIMLWIGILWFLVLIYMVVRLILVITDLNSRSWSLLNMETYDARLIQTNQYTKNFIGKDQKVTDILKIYNDSEVEINKYNEYIDNLNIPYEYFLQYVYLPHLNIWKNIYTDEIDMNMIWKNFLENNPYNDILLLQKRSDFFKNVWDNNELNDIKNIKIWDITEEGSWLFSIPVSLSFESKNKRSFLLLVDKISVTSNKTTLSLINEFFYYLRQEIKAEKKSEIETIKKDYITKYFKNKEVSDDKVIWLHLYNWIFYDQDNKLIDNDIIDETIKKVTYCDKEWNEKCYYKFREKYRDIPTFWYLVWWLSSSANQIQNFKIFISSLPPILSVKQFNFNQMDNTANSNRKYKWNITINVYGKWISQWEVDEIARKLWEKCYSKWWSKALSIDNALTSINEMIKSMSDIEKKNTSDSNDLRELKDIVETTSKEYSKYTNYKKVIKLFETYRMLDNIWLCNR